MSDQRLRELERRWKESGSPDDEAAYLLERVRVGDLTRERLELAAYCGHEGAMVAAAGGGNQSQTNDALDDLLQQIVHCKLRGRKEALIVAAIAAGRNAAELWAAQSTQAKIDRPLIAERRLAAAERWLECPCRRHAQEAGPLVTAWRTAALTNIQVAGALCPSATQRVVQEAVLAWALNHRRC